MYKLIESKLHNLTDFQIMTIINYFPAFSSPIWRRRCPMMWQFLHHFTEKITVFNHISDLAQTLNRIWKVEQKW